MKPARARLAYVAAVVTAFVGIALVYAGALIAGGDGGEDDPSFVHLVGWVTIGVGAVALAVTALLARYARRSADPAVLGERHHEHDHQRRRGGEHDPV